MKKNNSLLIVSLSLAAIIIIVIIVLQWGVSIDTPSISIPSPSTDVQEHNNSGGDSPLRITAESVQDLVAAIERPDSYSRKYSGISYWNGGEAVAEVSVYCNGDQYRIIHSLNGRVQNTLFSDDKMHIWYDGSSAIATFSKNSDEKPADLYARLIVFEELMDIPKEDILYASDVVYLGENCIYVEYRHSEVYIYHLYISVDKGLLVAAQVLENGNTVYTLDEETPDTAVPPEEMFTLPPG